jgi:hypothetical protein
MAVLTQGHVTITALLIQTMEHANFLLVLAWGDVWTCLHVTTLALLLMTMVLVTILLVEIRLVVPTQERVTTTQALLKMMVHVITHVRAVLILRLVTTTQVQP